jgi:hypothetical protein
MEPFQTVIDTPPRSFTDSVRMSCIFQMAGIHRRAAVVGFGDDRGTVRRSLDAPVGGAVCGVVMIFATVILAGCGSSASTLDTTRLQHAAAASILEDYGVHVRVSCPANVPRKAGFRFWCTALLDVGSYPLLVAETDDRGRLRYENSAPLRTLDIGRVRRAIAGRLAAAGVHGATVACPAAVIQQAGVGFVCDANALGRDFRFGVRELDGAGRIRFSQEA